MNFFIRQNSTMPYLSMELVQDGLNDYREFYDKIQNAVVTFSMEGVECSTKRVICQPMLVVEDKCNSGCLEGCFPKFYLVYQWRPRDTRKKGTFKGEIKIEFLDNCGVLIAPIREDLFINVI